MHFFAPGLRRGLTPSEAEVHAHRCVRAASPHMRGQPKNVRLRRASKYTLRTLVHQLIYCTRCQPDFLPSVTQRCQYLGVHIICLAGSSTLEVPSHSAVSIPIKSSLTGKPLKTIGRKQKKIQVFFAAFCLTFVCNCDCCSSVNMNMTTNMKPRGEWKLSLGITFCCKSACLPCIWCKGNYWHVHPAEHGDILGYPSREEIPED